VQTVVRLLVEHPIVLESPPAMTAVTITRFDAFDRYPSRPSYEVVTHATYVRRRLLVGLVLFAFCAAFAFAAQHALADRGGVPASTPSIRPASSPVAAAAGPSAAAAAGAAVSTYVVQPGDTIWSVARQFHHGHDLADYVDHLVSANGGTTLQIGQQLTLPS